MTQDLSLYNEDEEEEEDEELSEAEAVSLKRKKAGEEVKQFYSISFLSFTERFDKKLMRTPDPKNNMYSDPKY
jgi:hypothetical protein